MAPHPPRSLAHARDDRASFPGVTFASIRNMSDDFGTINLRRGERARELEVTRQHYRQHREALARMIADAPSDTLATEYQRLIAEIDRSLFKLDELDAGAGAPMPPPPPPQKTEPGLRPLVTTSFVEERPSQELPMGDE